MDWSALLEKTVIGVVSAAAVGAGKASYAYLKKLWTSRANQSQQTLLKKERKSFRRRILDKPQGIEYDFLKNPCKVVMTNFPSYKFYL